MKKYLFMLAALVMGLAACTTDPTPDGPKTDGDKTEVAATQLTRMDVQDGRLAEVTGTSDSWLNAPTYGEDTELMFSATSLDFSADDKYVYISWHSNRVQDLDEDSEEGHNHGTNVVGDNEPSLDADKTWGGILDVIEVKEDGSYAPVALYSQPEHKYNYVKLYGNNLYLASTSWFVGAALHVVPVSGSTLSTSDAYRVKLDGNSANCVEVVDGQILTVSGRTVGGLQLFAANAEVATANKVDAVGFGGKFAYATNDAVFVLYETKEGDNYIPYVQVWDKTLATKTEFKVESAADENGETEVYYLSPIDGKNVLTVDADGKVYVCCGKNGLHVFAKDEDEKYTEVGSSHKNIADNKNATAAQKYYAANGVAVDDQNIYIANGAGLVILDKTEQNKTNNGYKEKKNIQFDGTASWITPGNDKTKEDVVKESSNFVVVKKFGNKHYAFVAFGMYGLRICDISAYRTEPAPEPEPED